MKLIVQKYGGSSVRDKERVMNVARRIVEAYDAGNNVVVAVSAQGDTTDELIEKAFDDAFYSFPDEVVCTKELIIPIVFKYLTDIPSGTRKQKNTISKRHITTTDALDNEIQNYN